MQPHDQDELRRKAQEVLARRISTEPSAEEERPREPQPPRRAQPPRRQRRTERPRQQTRRVSQPSVEEGPRRVIEAVRPSPAERSPAPVQAERRPVDRSMSGLQPRQIRRALHDRNAIRQAIVLNEILGKPVSLRDEQGPGTFGGI